MKILICSDLHMEFPAQMSRSSLPPVPAVDLVIAAGDIAYDSVKTLKRVFPNNRVLFVPGNHEYYKSSYGAGVRKFQEESDDHVTVLNPGEITIDGQHFVGATLWSDLKLDGYEELPKAEVEGAINDFRLIRGFTADDMLELNKRESAYIRERATPESVVITHFVPTQRAIHPKWLVARSRRLNPYFTNDFEVPCKLHIFGHTHDAFDQSHNGVRYVCNPRGYPRENGPYEWKVLDL